MIDNIATNLWFSGNYASMKDIRRKCNSIADLSKFIFNKKILSELVVLRYNQVCSQICPFFILLYLIFHVVICDEYNITFT